MANTKKIDTVQPFSPFGKRNIRAILRSQNLHLSKHRGQNYLFDKVTAQKIISLLPIPKVHEIYLEVGTGLGALTTLLVDIGPTISFEIDKGIYTFIDSVLKHDNLTLQHQNFLTWHPDPVPPKPYLFIANLPYSISGEAIKKFVEEKHFDTGIITLQKEFVDRMIANPKSHNYGPLSVISQTFLEIKKHYILKKNLFFPEPSIDSYVIEIKKKNQQINQKEFSYFVKCCFLSKRKTLQNNIIRTPWAKDITYISGKMLEKRPDALSPAEWMLLFQNLRIHSHA